MSWILEQGHFFPGQLLSCSCLRKLPSFCLETAFLRAVVFLQFQPKHVARSKFSKRRLLPDSHEQFANDQNISFNYFYNLSLYNCQCYNILKWPWKYPARAFGLTAFCLWIGLTNVLNSTSFQQNWCMIVSHWSHLCSII